MKDSLIQPGESVKNEKALTSGSYSDIYLIDTDGEKGKIVLKIPQEKYRASLVLEKAILVELNKAAQLDGIRPVKIFPDEKQIRDPDELQLEYLSDEFYTPLSKLEIASLEEAVRISNLLVKFVEFLMLGNNVASRDLKSSNFMVSKKDGEIVVYDFNDCLKLEDRGKLLSPGLENVVHCSIPTLCPEIITMDSKDTSVIDRYHKETLATKWSILIIIFEILFGKIYPFKNNSGLVSTDFSNIDLNQLSLFIQFVLYMKPETMTVQLAEIKQNGDQKVFGTEEQFNKIISALKKLLEGRDINLLSIFE